MKLRMHRPRLAGLLATLALVATACGGGNGEEPETADTGGETTQESPADAGTDSDQATSGSGDSVVLGAVLPLTGASATIGDDQRRGIQLAVDEINANGGVLGGDLEVVVEDSEARSQAAIDAAQKLVDSDGAIAVMGEYSSGITLPLGQYLQREGVLHLNVGSSSGEIRNIGDWSFSVIGLEDVAGPFVAEDVWDRGYQRAAFIAPNNAYGEGALQHVSARYEELGGEIVESVLYTEGESDYRNDLERLSAADPDVYIYTAYGQDAATINQQAFELGLNDSPWYGIYLSMCTADSDPQAVEGQIGMEVNYVGPDGEWYREAYQEAYGEEMVTSFSAYLYDAVMLMARAIEEAGSADPAAVRDALSQVDEDYDPATGDIQFDEDGQRTDQPYIEVTYTDGEVVQE